MFYFVDESALLVAVLFSLAFATVWYAPQFFGAFFKSLQSEMVTQSNQVFVHTLLAHGILLGILYLILSFLSRDVISNSYMVMQNAVLYAGCVSACIGLISIWERRPLAIACIHIGYITLSIFFGMGIIVYWPW